MESEAHCIAGNLVITALKVIISFFSILFKYFLFDFGFKLFYDTSRCGFLSMFLYLRFIMRLDSVS